MAPAPVEKLHLHFHETVKAALESRVEETARSLNDVVVSILATKYGIAFHGTGRKSPGTSGAQAVNLRLPPRIYAAVDRENYRTKVSKNEIVERAVCADLGVEYVPHVNGRAIAAA